MRRGGRLLFRRTRPVSLSVVAVVLAALTGCTGGSGSAGASAASPPPPPAAKPCLATLPSVQSHPSWPRQLPLPPRTTVVSCEERSGGRLVIDAVVPTSFRSVLAFFQARFPAAGFTLGDGEVEPLDAESDFTGHGYFGRWSIRELESQTLLSMFTVPA